MNNYARGIQPAVEVALFKCKWREKRWQPPGLFVESYPGSDVHLVQRENYLEFLT